MLVDTEKYSVLCSKEYYFSSHYMLNTEAHLLVLVVKKKINTTWFPAFSEVVKPTQKRNLFLLLLNAYPPWGGLLKLFDAVLCNA